MSVSSEENIAPLPGNAATPTDPNTCISVLLDRWQRIYESDLYEEVEAAPEVLAERITPILNDMSEFLELSHGKFLSLNPDPDDERHPSKIMPSCSYGGILKRVFHHSEFLPYILSTGHAIVPEAVTQLVSNLLPGADSGFLSENEDFVERLFTSILPPARPSTELEAFSINILGAAMEDTQLATQFQEKNEELVPIALSRLKSCIQTSGFNPEEMPSIDQSDGDASMSGWAEQHNLIIGDIDKLRPLGDSARQRLIASYLSTVGQYPASIGQMFDNNVVAVIFHYIDINRNQDIRLAYVALRWLANMLCHKKFATSFMLLDGIQRLLTVRRPSLAASGVSIALYYIAYFDDTMTKLCQLPERTLKQVVNYCLWLLSSSHASSRNHSAMFFTYTLKFRVFLDLFEQADGLRVLSNALTTLEFVNTPRERDYDDYDPALLPAVRHAIIALSSYCESQLQIKADSLRRASSASVASPSEPLDSAISDGAKIPDNLRLLLHRLPLNHQWKVASEMTRLGLIPVLLKSAMLLTNYATASAYHESISAALLCLATAATTQDVQRMLLGTFTVTSPLPDQLTVSMTGVAVILIVMDKLDVPNITRPALCLLSLCANGPYQRSNKLPGGNHHRASIRMVNCQQHLQLMWDGLREANALWHLLRVLRTSEPVTEADSIRAAACSCLAGLARCNTVRHILSRLPLFTSGELQLLMREPVLADREKDYNIFVHHAYDLIERVTGKRPRERTEAVEPIRRAEIVAQTRIAYDDGELIRLIHHHLQNSGYKRAAEVLAQDSGLDVEPKQDILPTTPRGPQMTSLLQPPGTPIRFNLQPKTRPRHQRNMIIPHPAMVLPITAASANIPVAKARAHSNTLDKIVKSYLLEQHSYCQHLVATCPKFSLLYPHECPYPVRKLSAPRFTPHRLAQRAVNPPFGGYDGRRFDRQLVYRKFCPSHVVRASGDEFSACCFGKGSVLFLGTTSGDVKRLEVNNWTESVNCAAHNGPITAIQSSRDCNLILTSSTFEGFQVEEESGACTLWRTRHNGMDAVFSLQEETHAVLSYDEAHVLGTKNLHATLWDVSTQQLVSTFYSEKAKNNYQRNRACLNYTDELVLNDGVMWDVRAAEPVHKFDKFHEPSSGCFHPNNLEVIIGSEIWDLRTCRLLRSVNALKENELIFNNAGDVIFGLQWLLENNDDQILTAKPTFRTFHASDYSSIATIDLKRNIGGLAISPDDDMLAVVEGYANSDSQVGMYQIGTTGDVQVDEEERSDSGSDSDDSDEDTDEFAEAMEVSTGDSETGDDDDADFSVATSDDEDDDDDGTGDDDDDEDNLLYALD